MNRLKRIFAAAAALIAGGTAIGVALVQANLADPDPLTCREFRELLPRIESAPMVTYFVAVENGTDVPKAAGDFILGDCSARVCSVSPNNCNASIRYRFIRSGLAAGWRLYMVDSPKYFARGWRQAARGDAGIRFYSGWKEVKNACLADFTGGQCRNLLQGVSDCWRRPDGSYCRDGRLYGPGVGGLDAAGDAVTCTVGASDDPYPCDDRGKGPAWPDSALTSDFPPDEDLELP